MDNYTPKIINENGVVYLEMIIQADKCHLCKKIMLPKQKSKFNGGVFPNYIFMNQDAQMSRAGFVYSTNIEVDGKNICVECKEAGKEDILCALCDERKSTDKEEKSFGYPPEYLCKDCYEKVPAKKWDEMCDKLEDDHRWDLD